MDLFASAYGIILQGGPVMWPLLFASILALAVAFERMLFFRGVLSGAEEVIESATRRTQAGRIDEARAAALRGGGPIGRVLAAGFDRWQNGAASCEKAMEEQAMVERDSLSRRLVVLDTTITIAPLLGLLGTVVGMISAFDVVGSNNQIGAPTAIMGGVAEALIATATGLGIAIVVLLFFNYLNERVRQVISLMEIAGTRLVNLRYEVEAEEEEGNCHAPRAVSA